MDELFINAIWYFSYIKVLKPVAIELALITFIMYMHGFHDLK